MLEVNNSHRKRAIERKRYFLIYRNIAVIKTMTPRRKLKPLFKKVNFVVEKI
jgi:hypothetical protein